MIGGYLRRCTMIGGYVKRVVRDRGINSCHDPIPGARVAQHKCRLKATAFFPNRKFAVAGTVVLAACFAFGSANVTMPGPEVVDQVRVNVPAGRPSSVAVASNTAPTALYQAEIDPLPSPRLAHLIRIDNLRLNGISQRTLCANSIRTTPKAN